MTANSMSANEWTRVERLFHAAMEKPNNRRGAYLRDACDSEAEYEDCMRLVKAAQAADDFMSTSIGLAPFSASLTSADVLGNWRIEKVIGSGGMGEVYVVSRMADDFDHTAALKLARTKDPKYLARFEQERQILAKLEHANIGRLIDGGESADGQPYFVMELVDGLSITDYAAQEQLDQKAKLELFTQLCRAVSHAHTRLVLHRDIKPANVLVGGDGQVKLIDFGVSDDLDASTVSESAPATQAYAAPEQLAGGTISTATDIYAMGSLLFQLMTKTRYGTGETQAYKNLHRDLRAIIDKCLLPDPQDRFHSVEDLIKDMESYLAQKPVASRGGSILYSSERFVSRHKLLTGLFALMIIASGFLAFMLETDVISLRSRFYKTPPTRTIIACNNVAIAITETGIIYNGSPAPPIKTLLSMARELQKEGDVIRAFAVTPDCKGGVVISDKKDVFTYEDPDKNWQTFKDEVIKLRTKQLPINAIAFEPWLWRKNKSFIIAHKNGVQTSGVLDPELPELALTAVKGIGSLKSIAIRPRLNDISGWSIAGQNGYTYSRNITYEGLSFFPIIENMKQHGFITNYISFSPDNAGNLAYAFGNQDCEMSNISTPRDNQRCDYEAITGEPLGSPLILLKD